MSRRNVLTLETTTDFLVESCCNCGIVFAMPREYRDQKMRTKDSWYCPNGHAQHYLGKTHEQQLREARAAATAAEDQRRAAEQERDLALHHMREAKRETKRLEQQANRQAQRSRGGVCPCCDRSFVQLARHMKAKHPDHGKLP